MLSYSRRIPSPVVPFVVDLEKGSQRKLGWKFFDREADGVGGTR